MPFSFSGAAAGSSNALQQMLAQAFAERQQQAIEEQRAVENQRQAELLQLQQQQEQRMRDQFEADESYRSTQLNRQLTADRSAENQRGGRRMIGDLVARGGMADPATRQQAFGQAIGEGFIDPQEAFVQDDEPDLSKSGLEVQAADALKRGDTEGYQRIIRTIEDVDTARRDPRPPVDPYKAQLDALRVDRERARMESDRATIERADQALSDYADNVLSAIDRLVDNKGQLKPNVAGVIGPVEGIRPTGLYFSGGSNTALSDIDRLQSLLDLDVIRDMKSQSRTGATGFGQLSIRELDVLEAAASTLRNRRQGDPEYARELARIKNMLLEKRRRAQPISSHGDSASRPTAQELIQRYSQ